MNIRKKVLSFLTKPYKKGNLIYAYDAMGVDSVRSETELIIPKGCLFSGDIRFGKYSTIGNGCFFRGDIKIGNYCQLGANVSFHSRNHPIQYLTTYQNKRLFDGRLKELRTDNRITVGHDVWIGHGAIILSGVSIGNGAIIAAGAIVNRDVKPFSIVGGSPAKHIKFRFSKDSIDEINNLKWWDLEPKELSKLEDKFFNKYK